MIKSVALILLSMISATAVAQESDPADMRDTPSKPHLLSLLVLTDDDGSQETYLSYDWQGSDSYSFGVYGSQSNLDGDQPGPGFDITTAGIVAGYSWDVWMLSGEVSFWRSDSDSTNRDISAGLYRLFDSTRFGIQLAHRDLDLELTVRRPNGMSQSASFDTTASGLGFALDHFATDELLLSVAYMHYDYDNELIGTRIFRFLQLLPLSSNDVLNEDELLLNASYMKNDNFFYLEASETRSLLDDARTRSLRTGWGFDIATDVTLELSIGRTFFDDFDDTNMVEAILLWKF